MNNIIVTKAGLQDADTVIVISRETFFETYAQMNTEANMKKYLEENFGGERLRAELSNPDSQFFIAWQNEVAVGYLKLNTGQAQTDLKEEAGLEIERIYVKAAFQGRKIGQKLCEKAFEIARTERKSYVWLGVWVGNPKAMGFYTKNGFAGFGEHLFFLGNDKQTDILMKKEVK